MSADSFPVRWAGGLAVLTMPAEIDATNAGTARERMLAVLARDPVTLIVDMTPTQFCDSAGVRAILHAHQAATARQAELRLVIPAHAVRRAFTVTGLDQIIGLYPSLGASLAAGRPPAGPGTGHTGTPATAPGPEPPG